MFAKLTVVYYSYRTGETVTIQEIIHPEFVPTIPNLENYIRFAYNESGIEIKSYKLEILYDDEQI